MSSLAEKMYQRCHDGTASTSSTNSRPGSATKNPMTATRPAFLTCYLCGQGFGTSSLKIHQPQCYIKRLLQWEKGDPAIRGPKPTNPEDRAAEVAASPTSPGGAGGGGTKMSREAIDSFNDAQFNEFNEKSLVPCENCGRTFFPDRLQVHLRSCKPGAAAKPAPKRPATSITTPRDTTTTIQRGGGGGGAAAATRQSAPSFERPPSISRQGHNNSNGSPATVPPQQQQLRTSAPQGLNDDDAPQMADDVIIAPTTVNYALATDEDYPVGGRASGGEQEVLSSGGDRSHSPDQLIIGDNDGGGDVDAGGQAANDNANNNGDDQYGQEGGGGGDGTVEEDDSIAGGNFGEDTPIIPKRAKVQIHRPLDLSKALANRPSIFSGGGAAAESSLVPCQYCRRTFAPDRIEKHESVCTEKKTIVLSKGTPRRAAGGGVLSSTAGSVPGSVRSSVTALPLNNIRRGDPVRSSMGTGGGGGGGASTARGKSPRATTGAARSTTPRVGGSSSVMINGVPTTSARPNVARQLPTNGSSSRSPVRETTRGGGGYPPASLAPLRSSSSPSREEVVSPTPQQPQGVALSTGRAKFCTECGAKILSATQKFCGECGNRVADM